MVKKLIEISNPNDGKGMEKFVNVIQISQVRIVIF
jgi:hypothetical protein